MRYVRFHPDHLDAEALTETEKEELRLWLKNAETTARRAVAEYEEGERQSAAPVRAPTEVDAIWRAHKKWLLRNIFRNKCAYCEKSMDDIPKDAEHWRPKRRIAHPNARDHPGYFWLAYSWRNLLPSCSMCNSYDGKKDQFPVSRTYVFRQNLTDAEFGKLRSPTEAIPSETQMGAWYLGADDLDVLEEPLLLHPYVDRDPMKHLEFRPNGAVEGRTPKGECSIKVFALWREDLKTARYNLAERQTRTGLLERMRHLIGWAGYTPLEALDEAAANLEREITERMPYSAAKRAALARAVAEERGRLEREI